MMRRHEVHFSNLGFVGGGGAQLFSLSDPEDLVRLCVKEGETRDVLCSPSGCGPPPTPSCTCSAPRSSSLHLASNCGAYPPGTPSRFRLLGRRFPPALLPPPLNASPSLSSLLPPSPAAPAQGRPSGQGRHPLGHRRPREGPWPCREGQVDPDGGLEGRPLGERDVGSGSVQGRGGGGELPAPLHLPSSLSPRPSQPACLIHRHRHRRENNYNACFSRPTGIPCWTLRSRGAGAWR